MGASYLTIAALSAALAIEAVACVVLARSIGQANEFAVEAAAGQGRGGMDERQGAKFRYVRAYAPLSLRLESAAKSSVQDGSVTLVFPAAPGSPERALLEDVRHKRVSRLLVAGVLVDLVPGSKPSFEPKTGQISIRVSADAHPLEGFVQPAAVSLGAAALVARHTAIATTPTGGLSRVLVFAL
jgi:hypothetical protein